MIKFLWVGFTTVAGIAIGAGLCWGLKESGTLTIFGGAGGAVLGNLFGRFVPLSSVLSDL